MTKTNDASMAGVLAATRSGDLMGATRLIQKRLSGRAEVPEPAADAQRIGSSQIDRSAETVNSNPAPQPSTKPRKRRWSLPKIRLRTSTPPLVPEGGQYLRRTHSGKAGTRDYALYHPSGLPSGLIVMLHGCTQNADDFANGTGMIAVAEAHNLLVAFPEQPRAANANACWNWFEPAHQARDSGEPDLIADLTRSLLAEFNVVDALIAGLSAGGAMAAVMSEVYPELYKAVGIHSGLATGTSQDVASAFAAMNGQAGGAVRNTQVVPTLIVHGTADSTVHHSNAGRIVASFGIDPVSAVIQRFASGGRDVTHSVYRDGSVELWSIEGAGHAWSGGQAAGSFTDASGPDASAEMVRFFLGTTAP